MRYKFCLYLLALSCALAFPASAEADIVILKNGGRIEGTVIDRGDSVEVVIRPGVSTTIPRKDIEKIIIQTSPAQMYRDRARQLAADDALGHYHLGLWCKDQGLTREAEKEFKKVIKIHPGHEGARKELGHEKVDGKWLTKEEIMLKKGFVKYKNRWLPKEEAEKKRKLDELIKGIRGSIKEIEKAKGDPPLNAIEKLSKITDPAALNVLTKSLRSKNVHVRAAVAASLGFVGNRKTKKTLLSIIFKDKDGGVRAACAKSLFMIARKTGDAKEIKKLIEMMFKQGYPVKRKAAAEALGNIGDRQFITYLIRALVIEIQVKSKEEDMDPFGVPVTPEEKDRVRARGWRPRKLTNPGGVSVGPLKDKTKTKPWENPKALEALKKMTGQDFGYDQKKWQEWHLKDLEKQADEEEPKPEDDEKK
ncbi:MAG: HEAT repeat domain-containing protein [Planctomycetota bacterium]|nr:MAG: HEAT repeat domain-containing protein [Planctomycetota bacterium]